MGGVSVSRGRHQRPPLADRVPGGPLAEAHMSYPPAYSSPSELDWQEVSGLLRSSNRGQKAHTCQRSPEKRRRFQRRYNQTFKTGEKKGKNIKQQRGKFTSCFHLFTTTSSATATVKAGGPGVCLYEAEARSILGACQTLK